ncbi:MAG: hypothetical protein ACRELD_08285 [Longimicrobiales bacterium]
MEGRIDLTAVLPDAAMTERLVDRILAAAGVELARRESAATPIAWLATWARPALAAAAVVAIAAGGALAVLSGFGRGVEAELLGTGLVDALAVPAPADSWVIADRGPTISDLILAMEADE